MRKSFTLIAAGLAAIALSGCEGIGPIPEKVDDMSCTLLTKLADYQVEHKTVPFFLSQLSYPDDWRRIESGGMSDFFWLQAGSLKRLKNGKDDIYQITALTATADKYVQTKYRVQVKAGQCKSDTHTGKLKFLNFAQDNPSPFQFEEDFNLKGNTRNDQVARILCGYEALPELNKVEQMAQKWKSCVSQVPETK